MQKILISACLLGQDVKYNGGNNDITSHPLIQKLLKLDMLISVCPEVDGGLEIPRVPVEVKDGRAVNKDGVDKTEFFQRGAQIALFTCKKFDIHYAIFKQRSPSCGSGVVYDGTFSKTLVKGDGIAAKLLKESGIEIFSEENLEELEKILNI